ncbi:MAG: class II aldolase/adducin family protein [Clostridia bacterium]|nr:class II aldolase/adducin family protein [Clostridia bacterium]MBR0536654.1 class II aldolase/adducin family protein [Clostridia bacterium]
MELTLAKQAVVEAGIALVKEGLIQRTWGNVSCRVDEERFVITPSGRDYLSLTPDDVVLVNIGDLSYEGDIKPSSEKGIHANCYRLRPDVNFVIHTHQTYASIQGMSGFDLNRVPSPYDELLGDNVPLAAYGLPGTKKLKKGVADALLRSDSNAVLMFRHGAVCLGKDKENAFAVARALEGACELAVKERMREVSGKPAAAFKEIADYVAQKLTQSTSIRDYAPFDSVRVFGAAEMTPAGGGETVCIDLSTGMPLDFETDMPETAFLHAEIYNRRQDVQAICHSKEEATLAASRTGLTVRPFLDDFAQIVGLTLPNADYNPSNAKRTAKQVVKKLRRRDAVMLDHNGAICIGSDKEEAEAVKLVAEKGCKAFLTADLYGKADDPICVLECALMRTVYKLKYSKKK